MSERIQQLAFLFIFFAGLIFTSISTHADNTSSPIKNIVILGDSLSDNGNLFRGNVEWWVPIPAYFIPKPPYFNGRFSNGPIWADRMEDAMAANNINTINYAAGGALINWHVGLYLPYTLSHMINRFFNMESWATRLDDTLFIIWIGGNDYLHGIQYFSDVESDTDYTIHTLETNLMDDLISRGARNFLLINLPDISRAPQVTDPAKRRELRELAQVHNRKLNELSKFFKQAYLAKGINMHVFDAYSILEDLMNDPGNFNDKYDTNVDIEFYNVPCWTGGYRLKQSADGDVDLIMQGLRSKGHENTEENRSTAESIIVSPDLYEAWSVTKEYALRRGTQCANPENYVFWDKIHPTTTTHAVFNQLIMQAVAKHWG